MMVSLELPSAPPVTKVVATPLRRPKVPALVLLALGVILAVGPIVSGLFAKVAAGNQMIDQFAPYMKASALSRYRADLGILQRGTSGVDATYRQEDVTAGRFPLLDDYRSQSTAIEDRASGLLDLVTAAEPDYRRVANIGGFDRIPFLIVAGGVAAIYGGCVLLGGRASRARATVLLVVLTSTALAASPFMSGLYGGATAGHRMLQSLAPVMRPGEVRQLQSDFVVLVEAVGELDTSFRSVPQHGVAATDVAALVDKWPMVSSDLASLVGVIEDNIGNFDALGNLDAFTHALGVSGLSAFPWLLVSVGLASGGLSVAARPRRVKEM
jgi:hypothetical protein